MEESINSKQMDKEDIATHNTDDCIMSENRNTNESDLNLIESKTLLQLLNASFPMKKTDIKQYSPLTLAYIGDSIFDLIVRTIIVLEGNAPVNKLHRSASNLVKASAQMEMFHVIEEHLTEEEIAIFKRGRNAKSFTSAKNASISDYRTATGLEALMGYLYLTDQMPRIMQLMKIGLKK